MNPSNELLHLGDVQPANRDRENPGDPREHLDCLPSPLGDVGGLGAGGGKRDARRGKFARELAQELSVELSAKWR